MEQTPLPIDGMPQRDPKKEFANTINSLIESGYKLEDLETCITGLRSALKETDVIDEVNLMRLFAVVDYIRQCNHAGSVVINSAKSKNSLFDRLAEELCDGFAEDFIAKMSVCDDPECDFFFNPTNWITIIQNIPIVRERDNFLEMLGNALGPIKNDPLDYPPNQIGMVLLPSGPED